MRSSFLISVLLVSRVESIFSASVLILFILVSSFSIFFSTPSMLSFIFFTYVRGMNTISMLEMNFE